MLPFDAEAMKQEVRSSFRYRLRDLREDIGVTQAKFAKEMGVSRAAIGYYESGERLPDIAFAQTVSQRTGCSLDYLINGGNKVHASDDFIANAHLDDPQIKTLLNLLYNFSFRALLSDERIVSVFAESDKLASYGLGRITPVALDIEQHITALFAPLFFEAFCKVDMAAESNYRIVHDDRDDQIVAELNRNEEEALMKLIQAYREAHCQNEAFKNQTKNEEIEYATKALSINPSEDQTPVTTDKIEQYKKNLTRIASGKLNEK